MSTVHICNSFFEWELAKATPLDLTKALTLNQVVHQLQFLPFLYGSKGDVVGVTNLPVGGPYPLETICLADLKKGQNIVTWGYSELVQKWAEKQGHVYEMPDWNLIREINGKDYSFLKSPLPGARLLSRGDLPQKGHLLKTLFGVAGTGHRMGDHPGALSFCKREWDAGRTILSEPWVKKQTEFSTQWYIEKGGEITYLGVTECESTATGSYRGNVVGYTVWEEKWKGAIEEQKQFAHTLLKEMKNRGYFGPVGFDAMIYGKNELQPALEINARRTFGFVALAFRKVHFPGKAIRLSFSPNKEAGFLPLQAGSAHFARQIKCSVL